MRPRRDASRPAAGGSLAATEQPSSAVGDPRMHRMRTMECDAIAGGHASRQCPAEVAAFAALTCPTVGKISHLPDRPARKAFNAETRGFLGGRLQSVIAVGRSSLGANPHLPVAYRNLPSLGSCMSLRPIAPRAQEVVARRAKVSRTGRSSAWLERLLWEQEAPGSNPGVPIKEVPGNWCASAVRRSPCDFSPPSACSSSRGRITVWKSGIATLARL